MIAKDKAHIKNNEDVIVLPKLKLNLSLFINRDNKKI